MLLLLLLFVSGSLRDVSSLRPAMILQVPMQRGPQHARNLDDPWIGQKLREISAHRCRGRCVRRAEIDEQNAKVRSTIMDERWFLLQRHAQTGALT